MPDIETDYLVAAAGVSTLIFSVSLVFFSILKCRSSHKDNLKEISSELVRVVNSFEGEKRLNSRMYRSERFD